MIKLAKQTGITMIEVLVTLLITVIGLVGSLSLQGKMHQSLNNSFYKTQALIRINDISDRIRSNVYAASCYNTNTGHLGTNSSRSFTCTGFGSTDTQKIAENDLTEIDFKLKGGEEINAQGELVGGMPNARACIIASENLNYRTFRIVLNWDGLTKSKQEDFEACGETNEKTRSLVQEVVLARLAAD